MQQYATEYDVRARSLSHACVSSTGLRSQCRAVLLRELKRIGDEVRLERAQKDE